MACGIYTKIDIVTYDNATEEVLSDKLRCEYGFYQRVDSVSVSFSNKGSIQQSANGEVLEKGIKLAVYL
jgi:hypothetical protein